MRTKIVYVGLDPSRLYPGKSVLHLPLIRIAPLKADEPSLQRAVRLWDAFTHVVVTSRAAAALLPQLLPPERLHRKRFLAVGAATAQALPAGCDVVMAPFAQAEGIAALLGALDKSAFVFYPHSRQARSVVARALHNLRLRHYACVFYDTLPTLPHFTPDWSLVEKIVFTSPSTVDAFLGAFARFPDQVLLEAIGPITKAYLARVVVQNR